MPGCAGDAVGNGAGPDVLGAGVGVGRAGCAPAFHRQAKAPAPPASMARTTTATTIHRPRRGALTGSMRRRCGAYGSVTGGYGPYAGSGVSTDAGPGDEGYGDTGYGDTGGDTGSGDTGTGGAEVGGVAHGFTGCAGRRVGQVVGLSGWPGSWGWRGVPSPSGVPGWRGVPARWARMPARAA